MDDDRLQINYARNHQQLLFSIMKSPDLSPREKPLNFIIDRKLFNDDNLRDLCHRLRSILTSILSSNLTLLNPVEHLHLWRNHTTKDEVIFVSWFSY